VEQVHAWLAGVVGQGILLMLGAAALKRWPEFINKAIPLALGFISLVLTVLKGAFPALVSDASAATMLAAVGHAAPWWQTFALDTVAPVVFAIGTHSAAKNTREWWALGLKLFKAARE
jgi:hypothetical protein